MKTKLLLFLVIVSAMGGSLSAQGIIYQLTPPAPNAQVLVCPSPDNGYPCPNPAAIFSNVGLSTSVPQPVTLGSSGFFSFYIAAGTYTIQLLGPGYNSGNRQVVTIGGGGGGGFPVTTAVAINSGGSLTVNTGGSIATAGSGTNAATSAPFSGVTAGTGTAALIVGTGGSVTTSGTGTIMATNGLLFVAALPGTCTPGVTVNVLGSVAINGYNAGQEFWCSATNIWSPVVATFNVGNFTNTQYNSYISSFLPNTCSPLSIINQGGTTYKYTDAITACAIVPTGAGVTNAQTNAIAGLIENDGSGASGQFGWVAGIGIQGSAYCTQAGRCWGGSFGAEDRADGTIAAQKLFGIETDVQINNAGTTGFGQLYSFRGNGQPTADTFPAVAIQLPGGTGSFTSGYECQDGSIAGTVDCVSIGQQLAGATQNSGVLSFYANIGGRQRQYMQLLKASIMSFGGYPIAQINPAGMESWGIALTSTAQLAANQLVKPGAGADSVVVCTTADTTACIGFVQSTESAGQLCLATNNTCPIVAGSGSKVLGILGTGTCAIGNYVIVDTTTNGRIQCVVAQPPTYLGIALSAQAGIGSNVDILSQSTAGPFSCTNVTPVTVNANVTTDQNLMTCSIPANTLNRVGRTMRISLSGVYSTPAASVAIINVKVKLGSLTLATFTTTALGGIQATNDQFNIMGMTNTVQTAGATAAFEPHGNLVIDLGVGNTVADSTFADVNTATVSSVDTTATQTLQITIGFSTASGSNTATQRQLIVETVN